MHEFLGGVCNAIDLPFFDRYVCFRLLVACKLVDSLMAFRPVLETRNPQNIEMVVVVGPIVRANR